MKIKNVSIGFAPQDFWAGWFLWETGLDWQTVYVRLLPMLPMIKIEWQEGED